MPQSQDPDIYKWIAEYLLAAFAAVSLWAWKHTHRLVRDKAEESQVLALAAAIKEKADAIRVDQVIERIDGIARDQREDNQRIFAEIAKVVDAHSKFAERAIEEFGKRPTRDECGWRLHGGIK